MREDNNTKAAWAYIDYECADSANDAINCMNKQKVGFCLRLIFEFIEFSFINKQFMSPENYRKIMPR